VSATDLIATLRTHFGFQEFRPGQEEAIGCLLAGQHTLVVMPTGAGKSLIYQLAALHRPGLTLVISPLIALMKDQVDGLARHGIAAAYVNSTLAADEQARRLGALGRDAYRLVYVSPERLRNAAFIEALRGTTVSLPAGRLALLAVDEAHCISQWGHDFRPDYLHIAAAREALGRPLTAALTATATPQVQADIIRLLGLPAAQSIVTGFNRPNLALEVRYTAEPAAKLAALQELLVGLDGGAAIIYVGTRRDAEEVADFVREVCKLRVEFYHAGLHAETRTRVQNAFLAHAPGASEAPGAWGTPRGGGLQVVVATNAFGMGIDRPDVRLVAHFAMPGTLEAYYQEVGRAGRDGLPARAVLLYSPKDRALQEWFIENDAPAANEVRSLYDAIRAANLTPYPLSYQERWHDHPLPSQGGGQGGRLAGRRDVVWLTAEDLSLASGLPEVKLKVGLAQLEAAGSLERLGDAGPRMLLRTGPWNAAAVQDAAVNVEARRRHRRSQLAQMVAYAESNACRRRILLDHFGDRAAAEASICCDNCQQRAAQREKTAIATAPSPPAQHSPAHTALVILDAVRRLKWEIGKEKLAQLLRGSSAKEMHLYSYDRSPYYGRLAVFSMHEVGGLIDQLLRGGYLKVGGGEMPVLKLTPKAEAAIRDRAAIPLQLPRAIDPEAVAMKQAEREAGGTVALTAQLAGQGLTPAEIAACRGLTENTILGHLAELIAERSTPLAAAVPDEIVAQIEAAIAQVGSTAQLSPIKQLLPETISFGQIRCVVAGQRMETDKRRMEADKRMIEEELVARGELDGNRETSGAILACVRSLPGQLPRSGVAKLLVGSESARVEEFRGHPLFGALSGRTREAVLGEVDRLIEAGVLAVDEHGKVIAGAKATVEAPPARPGVLSPTERVQQVVALGEARSPAGVPELVAALADADGNVRRLAASALGKIGDRQAVEPLMDLLARETRPQVRQYAVKALGSIGDGRARTLLEQIASGETELDYTRKSAQEAIRRLTTQPTGQPTDQSTTQLTAWLNRSHPRPLRGPWEAGWALGFHSRFAGADWSRSPVGELAYRLKYGNDATALAPLVEQARALCIEHPELADVDALVPVPSSQEHAFDSVGSLAEALAGWLGAPVWKVVVKTRRTAPQKEMHTLAQKRANVAGAFAVQGSVRGKRLLVLDDLYDSGATLAEVAHVLRMAGAARLCVLTLTRTIHADA